ncbi:hypothetical protein GCM10023074_67120 [Microbispora amethystogenes]|uniref:Uncharacterized protein n=2 Tax=Microbispora amethystogenes TaxID=1427754 RepID=A0ABQ4FMN2_9ACTN|nr:hypothetical protein Mam01_62360 [Microbispora amethystogenes]
MAEIIKRLLDPWKIEPYLRGVADVEAPWSVAGGTSGDEWITIGPDGIALDAAHYGHALIEYELWDGEPPASDWEESRSGSIYLTSGKICAITSYVEEIDEDGDFDLGRPGQEWRFRAHRKPLSHENFTADVIRLSLFKLQFWAPTEDSRM